MADIRDPRRQPQLRPTRLTGEDGDGAQHGEPGRLVRCPFAMAALRGIDMSVCPGYELELIGVAVEDTRPSAAVCGHLGSAPHPGRDAMVGVCRHPQAPWVAHTARRMLVDGDLQAVSGPVGESSSDLLIRRAVAAQLHAAHLAGRTRIIAMCLPAFARAASFSEAPVRQPVTADPGARRR